MWPDLFAVIVLLLSSVIIVIGFLTFCAAIRLAEDAETDRLAYAYYGAALLSGVAFFFMGPFLFLVSLDKLIGG